MTDEETSENNKDSLGQGSFLVHAGTAWGAVISCWYFGLFDLLGTSAMKIGVGVFGWFAVYGLSVTMER